MHEDGGDGGGGAFVVGLPSGTGQAAYCSRPDRGTRSLGGGTRAAGPEKSAVGKCGVLASGRGRQSGARGASVAARSTERTSGTERVGSRVTVRTRRAGVTRGGDGRALRRRGLCVCVACAGATRNKLASLRNH